MSDSTIEQLEEAIKQLEALKDGITPGPWQWSDHRVPDLTGDGLWPIVIEADHDGGRMGDCTLELHIKDEDKRLIAAAPALVDALIAEKRAHAELRAEVEKQRDIYKYASEFHKSAHNWDASELWGLVGVDLTSILEATDE